jgi:hypothetical protein
MPFTRQKNISPQEWQEVSRIVELDKRKDEITETVATELKTEINELAELTSRIAHGKINDAVESIKKNVIRGYVSSYVNFGANKTRFDIMQLTNEVKKILNYEIKNKLEELRKSYESQLKELFFKVLDFNFALKYITQDEYNSYYQKLDGKSPFDPKFSWHDLLLMVEYTKSTAFSIKDVELSKLFRENRRKG